MATRIKSSQIADGAIVAADLHSAITVSTTSSGTFGSVIVDDITLDGSSLTTSGTNDFTVDSGGKIVLDADSNGDIRLANSAGQYASLYNSGDHLYVKAIINEGDVYLSGKDSNGAHINGLRLDFGNSGRATFNENIVAGGTITGVTTLTSSGVISTSNTTGSTNTTSGALTVAGGIGVAENAYIGGNVIVTGDLTVEGTQVTLNTTALDVEDKNITLNYHASNDTSASADGAGITIQDAVNASTNATILWNASIDRFAFSHGVNVSGDSQIGGNLDLAASTTETRSLQIGQGRTGDGISLIDLVGDTTYSDYGFRIQRAGTDSGKSSLLHKGTGNLEIRAIDAATIRFKTTDADRMQIKSAGDIHFYDTAGDPGMVWDASEGSDGALLIGGHTALRSGSVAGRNDAQLSLESTNFHNASFVANQNTANGYHLIIGKSRGTDVGDVDIVQALDEIGSLVFAAADGTDLRPKVAQISAYVPSGTTPGVNTVSGELRFGTTNQAQDVTNHMVLDKDGKVGIGILTPETLLHVQKSSSALYTSSMSGVASYTPSDADMIQVRNSNTGVNDIYAGIWFETGTGATNTTGTDRAGRIALVVDNDSAYSSNFVFQTRGSAGTLTEKMRITQEGKVGIGTDNPDCALDVTTTTGWAEMHLDGASGGDLVLKDNGVSYGEVYAGNGHGLVVKSYASQDIYFLTNAEATAKMVIESGGNVGIGADPAVHKLDVDGAIATRQVRHNIRPTLNLDFANSKQLDPRITFHRASTGTYYDSKGIIQYATENEPRFDYDPLTGESKGLLIEEARTNIVIGDTNFGLPIDFNAMYNITNTRLAPDGTMSATDVLANSGVSRHEVNIKYPGTTGTVYTASVYVKPLGAVQWLVLSRAGGTDQMGFDLINITTNVPGGTASGTISEVGNGWIKLTFSFTEGTTGSVRSVYMSPGITTPTSSVYSNLNGNGLNGITLWGAQVEVGSFSTSYIPSDTRFTSRASEATYYDETGIIRTAPANYPRYSHKYDGRKWVETGLILESAATNLIVDGTSGFSASAGTQIDSTTEIAPDGSQTAVQFSTTVPSGNRTFSVPGYIPVSADTVYTYSCYVKNVNMTGWSISFPQNASTGTITIIRTKNTTISEMSTTEWKRMEITFKTGSSNGAVWVQDFRDGGTGSAILWGKQLEAGDSATSYIYTGAATTRSADVASSVAYTRDTDIAKIYNFSDHFNSEELTAYVHASSDFEPETNSRYYEASSIEGNTDDRMISYYNGGYRFLWRSKSVNDVVFSNADTWSNFNEIKQAATWKNGVANVADSTGNSQSDTSAGSKSLFTVLHIGNDTTESSAPCAHFKKLAFYEKALSTTELQALTENN